ncbi:hypothetical protein C0992_001594 [Termitomyces sp. T32_za158]|nr:hypothetical protein C0992_001594 [Termitomyces sp. T32_za158]
MGGEIYLVSLYFRLIRLSLEETTSKRAPPPGHAAWEPSKTVKESPWIPSGSLFSPSSFKHALSLSRDGCRKALSVLNPIFSDRRLPQSGSFRKALVFEHEITLNTEGQQKRWSLQVPAANMNPEMVDIMLELQDLNSFFKDSLVSLDENVAVLEKEKDKLSLEPPTLVISDSRNSFSLPSESLANSRHDSCVPLAARRGRRLLPPIAIGEKKDQDPYPSIPTAFLGSPSTYSPKFESVLSSDGPSLDLEHMVTSLRSQCVFPRAMDDSSLKTPICQPLSEMSFSAVSDSGNTSDDDWAFAVSFMDEFGDRGAELKSNRAGPHPVIELKPVSLPHFSSGVSERLSNESLTPRAHSPAHPPSPVPSTPLPLLPSPQVRELSSMTPSPRGILKSSKSVRFASLPEMPDMEYTPATPTMAGSSIPQLPKAPSRPNAYSRLSKQTNTNSSVSGIPSQTISGQGGNTKTEKVRSTRTTSVEVSKPAFVVHKSPPRPHITATEARKSTPNLLGRQPFGRLDNRDENQKKKEVLVTPSSKAGLRWTMNDMTFRRGSTSNQATPDGTPRSRMPVPLRNILTRFK